MRTVWGSLVFAIAWGIVPDRGEAQSVTRADSDAVVIAAVSAGARDLYDVASRRLLSRQIDRARSFITPQLLTGLTRAASAVPANKSDVIHCAESKPSACDMDGSAQLLFVEMPRFAGDSALVSVGVFRRTTSKIGPIAMRAHDYVLRKRNGVWAAVRIAIVSAT